MLFRPNKEKFLKDQTFKPVEDSSGPFCPKEGRKGGAVRLVVGQEEESVGESKDVANLHQLPPHIQSARAEAAEKTEDNPVGR